MSTPVETIKIAETSEMGETVETIAAIATAPGYGGVGIIRISGPASQSNLKAIFRSSSPKFQGFKPWMLHHGHILDENGEILDEVLVVAMPGPRSFTGENVAEIHCHGGPAILKTVLELIFTKNGRMAAPGEFTRRAFLNGRMDLTQAEAVAECIAAPAREALRAAQSKLKGGLGQYIQELRASLIHIRANLALAVDFPEEELEIVPLENLIFDLKSINQKITNLLAAHQRMKPFREGALVVIAGQVNVGKSSLLNALLGRNRAIVTNQPGTTRDFLEEQIIIKGLPLRLVDTAGLRKTKNEVERQGLGLAQELFEQADLILLMVDKLHGPSDYELELLKKFGPTKILGVANKCDLANESSKLENWWPDSQFNPAYTPLQKELNWFDISAKFSQGILELGNAIHQKVLHNLKAHSSTAKGNSNQEAAPTMPENEANWNLAPNLRQAQVLGLALEELQEILQDAASQVPYDLLGVRVELLSAILDEVTGQIAPDDVLDLIFAEFCLGK